MTKFKKSTEVLDNMEIKKSVSISNRCKVAKKMTFQFTVALCTIVCMSITAFADVDASAFISNSVTVLKGLIILIGAGLGIWGIINLLEGYGNDNAGAKSQGIKQTMAGVGLILTAIVLVPVLGNMMTGVTG